MKSLPWKFIPDSKVPEKNVDNIKTCMFKTNRVKVHSAWEKTKSIYKFRLIQNTWFIKCQKLSYLSDKSNKIPLKFTTKIDHR